MWTLARDIASATRQRDGVREPWSVDPLTRKVYVYSVTALLQPDEAARLQDTFTDPLGHINGPIVSTDGAGRNAGTMRFADQHPRAHVLLKADR
jgi:hypothetical protein